MIASVMPAPVQPYWDRLKKFVSEQISTIEESVNIHASVVCGLRSGDEILIPLPVIDRIAEIAGKILLPLRGLSLLIMPFQAFNFCKNGVLTVKAPWSLKAAPLMKMGSELGGFLDNTGSAAGLVALIPGCQAVGAAVAPLSGVGAIFQLFGAGFTAAQCVLMNKKWSKVNRLLGRKDAPKTEPSMNQYADAVDFLTREPQSKIEKYKNLFFDPFQKVHKEKLKEIFDKSAQGLIPEKVMGAAFRDMKEHIIRKNAIYAISIALLIIGVVGVLMLIFAPTPLSAILIPLGWGLIAASSIGGAGLIGFNLYCNFSLKRRLKKRLNGFDDGYSEES